MATRTHKLWLALVLLAVLVFLLAVLGGFLFGDGRQEWRDDVGKLGFLSGLQRRDEARRDDDQQFIRGFLCRSAAE